ncbi:hypothetical protein AAC387_Pa07g1480 [Persea americana]
MEMLWSRVGAFYRNEGPKENFHSPPNSRWAPCGSQLEIWNHYQIGCSRKKGWRR